MAENFSNLRKKIESRYRKHRKKKKKKIPNKMNLKKLTLDIIIKMAKVMDNLKVSNR